MHFPSYWPLLKCSICLYLCFQSKELSYICKLIVRHFLIQHIFEPNAKYSQVPSQKGPAEMDARLTDDWRAPKSAASKHLGAP